MMKNALGLLLAVLVSAPLSAVAQEFPARPIRLLVGFPPGGNVDVVGRIVAQKMAEGLGRTVVVETRAGAGGIIANDLAAIVGLPRRAPIVLADAVARGVGQLRFGRLEHPFETGWIDFTCNALVDLDTRRRYLVRDGKPIGHPQALRYLGRDRDGAGSTSCK